MIDGRKPDELPLDACPTVMARLTLGEPKACALVAFHPREQVAANQGRPRNQELRPTDDSPPAGEGLQLHQALLGPASRTI